MALYISLTITVLEPSAFNPFIVGAQGFAKIVLITDKDAPSALYKTLSR